MTSSPTRSGPILGSLRSAGGRGIVRVEHRLGTDIDDVWSAITDPVRLAQWHAEVEGDLSPGGSFRLYLESDDWEGTGRVEECEPPRRFVVTTRESEASWRKGQGAPPFDEVVEATLSADGDHTGLAVEIAGIPLDLIAFYGVGWQLHAEHLAAYLSGGERGDVEARWEELLPAYHALAAGLGNQ